MGSVKEQGSESKLNSEPTPLEIGGIADATIRAARLELYKANLEAHPDLLKQILALAALMLDATWHAYRLKDR